MEDKITNTQTENKKTVKKNRFALKLSLGIIGATIAGAGIATGVCYGIYSRMHRQYTITFERGNEGYFASGSGLVNIDRVIPFGQIAKPEIQSLDETKVFAGWYLNDADETPYLDTQNVTSNLTLKPKFVSRTDTNYIIVKFDKGSIGGATLTGNTEFAIKKEEGKNYFGLINRPFPYALNYNFIHWSKNKDDPSKTEDIMWNDTPITSEITTLYPYYQYDIEEVLITGPDDMYVQTKYKYTYKILGSQSPIEWYVYGEDMKPTDLASIDKSTGLLTANKTGVVKVAAVPTIVPEKAAIKTITINNPYRASDEIGCYGEVDGKTCWWTISTDSLYGTDQIKLTKFGNVNDVVYVARDKFNLPIYIGDMVAGIKNNFLQNCTSFNSDIIFQATSTTASIGDNFLYGCKAFNKELRLPSKLLHIGNDFLQDCFAYNNGALDTTTKKPLTIPSEMTTISNNFLYGCKAFNQELILPDSIKCIESNFLYECSQFNSKLTLSNGLTTIGDHFLNDCSSFNVQLDIPQSVKKINESFMYHCTAYSKNINIPVEIDKIGASFMYECTNFSKVSSVLTINTTKAPSDIFYKDSLKDETLSVYADSASAYQQGVGISGSQAEALIAYLGNRDSSPFRKLIKVAE